MKAKISCERFKRALISISTEETRYYLNGVHVEPCPVGGVLLVSTDGHRLTVIRDPDATMRGDPKIIRLSKDMAKALSVRDAHSLLIDGDLAGVVSLCDTGEPLNAKTALAFQAQELIIDGRFPDWRRVVPSAPEKSAHFAVAGKYVADMTSAMSLTIAKIKGRTTTNPCLRVFAESDNEPILCRGSDPNAFGVLMPMRLPEMAATEILPDWL